MIPFTAMTLTLYDEQGMVKRKDLGVYTQVLMHPASNNRVFNRGIYSKKKELMKNIKGISDALVPMFILIGLIGVETMSTATQYVAVAGLITITIIQTICYAYNKVN